jgi:hypothetical protein
MPQLAPGNPFATLEVTPKATYHGRVGDTKDHMVDPRAAPAARQRRKFRNRNGTGHEFPVLDESICGEFLPPCYRGDTAVPKPILFTSLLLRGRNYLDLLRYPAPPLLNVR